MRREVIEVDKPWTRTVPFSLGVVFPGMLVEIEAIASLPARDPL